MENKDKVKKIFIGAILLLFLVLIIVGVQKDGQDNLVVVLDFGASRKTFQVSSSEQERAWGLLQQAAVLANTNLEATNDFRPKRIDGLTNGDDNKQWVFYVNGIKQEASPFNTFINPPAEVVFRFE